MATKEKKEPTELQQEMDAAARKAKTELQSKLSTWKARDVAAWWKRHYMQAGHKRLGRVLVELGKAE